MYIAGCRRQETHDSRQLFPLDCFCFQPFTKLHHRACQAAVGEEQTTSHLSEDRDRCHGAAQVSLDAQFAAKDNAKDAVGRNGHRRRQSGLYPHQSLVDALHSEARQNRVSRLRSNCKLVIASVPHACPFLPSLVTKTGVLSPTLATEMFSAAHRRLYEGCPRHSSKP